MVKWICMIWYVVLVLLWLSVRIVRILLVILIIVSPLIGIIISAYLIGSKALGSIVLSVFWISDCNTLGWICKSKSFRIHHSLFSLLLMLIIYKSNLLPILKQYQKYFNFWINSLNKRIKFKFLWIQLMIFSW